MPACKMAEIESSGFISSSDNQSEKSDTDEKQVT